MKYCEQLMKYLGSGSALFVSACFLVAGLYGHIVESSLWEKWSWGAVLISGLPLLVEALENLCVHRRVTSPLLIAIAMGAAIGIGEVFAAAEVAFLMALGEWLEHRTLARAHRGLERLMRLEPDRACRIEAGLERTVSVEEIRPGDVLRIRAGESIPADGRVVRGASSVDQSVLTGESLPVECGAGDAVFAGTLNGEGLLDICVEREVGDSSLRRLVKLVREAQANQAPVEREADRWAGYIVPAAVGISLVGYVVLRLLGYSFDDALTRAITVLVVFCPCALALATPTAMMAAIGQAAKRGVVIKSGAALELLGKVTALAFDKTGTLTQGRPEVCAVIPFGAVGKSELLATAAAVEKGSSHPLARAVARAADGLEIREMTEFRSIPGRGVAARLGKMNFVCGSEHCLREMGISLAADELRMARRCREQGMATMLVAADGRCLGVIGVSDTPRPEAASVLKQLASYRTVLLTGDHADAAENIAKMLDLRHIYVELLPEGKVEKLKELQQEECVAMVGDGVNDAPALKQAHVGISMSHVGSDIATEAADISLMNDDLSRLPYLLRLAKATLFSIRFNIALSMAVNFVAVALSLLGWLNPVTGALVHNAGSVLVILNATFLYDRRFD